ncbi:BON domain-containing protein [Aquabacterium sp.]|uniref:BON domain-containing protein n=1 Tax=Aquabacterium sp. TaxID=1872578 RepID=UPI0037844A22
MTHPLHRLAFLATLSAALGCALLSSACSSTPTQASLGETVDAFVDDKAVSALNIQVETFKGNVQLSGFANSGDERRRAEELASAVKGVKSVKNDIRLKTDNG